VCVCVFRVTAEQAILSSESVICRISKSTKK